MDLERVSGRPHTGLVDDLDMTSKARPLDPSLRPDLANQAKE